MFAIGRQFKLIFGLNPALNDKVFFSRWVIYPYGLSNEYQAAIQRLSLYPEDILEQLEKSQVADNIWPPLPNDK